METREFEVRLADEAERTVMGIAVPYGDTIDVGGYRERFVRGAFGDISDVKLFYGHREPIGSVVRGQDTDEGFVIEARISKTPRGDEVHTLLRDGVLNKFSVGFEAIEDGNEDGVVVRTKARLREVSVVAFPAYEGASVLAVREAEPTDTKEEAVEAPIIDTEARERLDDMDRRMAVLADRGHAGDSIPEFRSYGEFIKAFAAGDDKAVDLAMRAYTGATILTGTGGDSIGVNAWISDAIRLVDMGRPTWNAFRNMALPAEGMNVEWPEVKTDGIQVDVQAAEGDLLAFGKLTLESKTSPVKTIGGWTEFSRQVIERSSVAYVEAAFRALLIHYGQRTNLMAITALTGQAGVSTANLPALATAKGKDWVNMIADASIAIYTGSGLRPEFILASSDVWKASATLFDTQDRPLLATSNPQNNLGGVSLPGLTGNIGGLPIVVDPALPAKSLYVANSEALGFLENGGPTRLVHDNITVLTQDVSIYGYVATTGPIPKAICKVTVA